MSRAKSPIKSKAANTFSKLSKGTSKVVTKYSQSKPLCIISLYYTSGFKKYDFDF